MIISCARTNLPIGASPDWRKHPFARAVLLRDGRPPVAGRYDGAGSLEGLDLRSAGILDEIRAGTACLVLGDHHRAGDTPAGLGPSRIEEDPAGRPGREFIAACMRIGPFATYEGYVMARDGHVTPAVGAALKDADIRDLRRITDGLRRAVARGLSGLASGSSRTLAEIEELVAPTIGIEVVPLDARCERLKLCGGDGLVQCGLPFQIDRVDLLGPPAASLKKWLDGSPDWKDAPPRALERLAADLLQGFPPRKRASVIVTRDEGPVGAVALYRSREIGTGVYVSWYLDGFEMSATPEQAVADLGISDEDADGLFEAVAGLGDGQDRTVPLRVAPGPRA